MPGMVVSDADVWDRPQASSPTRVAFCRSATDCLCPRDRSSEPVSSGQLGPFLRSELPSSGTGIRQLALLNERGSISASPRMTVRKSHDYDDAGIQVKFQSKLPEVRPGTASELETDWSVRSFDN